MEIVRLLLDGGAQIDQRRTLGLVTCFGGIAYVAYGLLSKRVQCVTKNTPTWGHQLAPSQREPDMEKLQRRVDQIATVNSQFTLGLGCSRARKDMHQAIASPVDIIRISPFPVNFLHLRFSKR